jgi:hypothetical protein
MNSNLPYWTCTQPNKPNLSAFLSRYSDMYMDGMLIYIPSIWHMHWWVLFHLDTERRGLLFNHLAILWKVIELSVKNSLRASEGVTEHQNG